MRDILVKIMKYRNARHWSEYRLAEESGVPQSTISAWYSKGAMPSLPSLQKICDAFDITMSELFAVDGEPVVLTETQKELLERWNRLDKEKQQAFLRLIEHM